MRNGQDITSEVPITDELHYDITKFLIPSLSKHSQALHAIRIDATLEPPLKEGFAVGTSCSCGVDSFYSILMHRNSPYKELNLTHLCINSVGSFNNCYREYGPENVRIERFAKASEVAKKLNLRLVATNSNFSEAFPQVHLLTHTYSSTFAIYVLQKMWRVYYLPSAGLDYSHFSIQDTENTDCAYYDLLTLQCFSTSRLRVVSDGASENRFEKVREIADDPIVQEYLHVCTRMPYNCGECGKCKRTMIMLDAAGKLDRFNKVFNIDHYREHISDYYHWLFKVIQEKGEEWDFMRDASVEIVRRKNYIEESKKFEREMHITQAKRLIKRPLRAAKKKLKRMVAK